MGADVQSRDKKEAPVLGLTVAPVLFQSVSVFASEASNHTNVDRIGATKGTVVNFAEGFVSETSVKSENLFPFDKLIIHSAARRNVILHVWRALDRRKDDGRSLASWAGLALIPFVSDGQNEGIYRWRVIHDPFIVFNNIQRGLFARIRELHGEFERLSGCEILYGDNARNNPCSRVCLQRALIDPISSRCGVASAFGLLKSFVQNEHSAQSHNGSNSCNPIQPFADPNLPPPKLSLF